MFVPFRCKVVLGFVQIAVASDKQRELSCHPSLRNKSGWCPTDIRGRPNGGRTVLQLTFEIPTHVLSHYAWTYIPTQFTRCYVDIPTTPNRVVMLMTYIRDITASNLDREIKYPDWSPRWFSAVPQGKCKDSLRTSRPFIALCQILSNQLFTVFHSSIHLMAMQCELLKGALNTVWIKN